MSAYNMTELADWVRWGFADEGISAWHAGGIPVEELVRIGRAFAGPVPRDVAEQLLLWSPVDLTVHAFGPDGREYAYPDRLSRHIGNPLSGDVINVAGSGFNKDLHLEFDAALDAATDAGLDIASVVCLGNGAHMGMSFRVRDGVTLGGDFGGATPLVGFNSSLTGAIATQLDTGTVLRVCDNTMRLAASTSVKSLTVKRTRFSAGRVTPGALREALSISFADTDAFCVEMARLANISAPRDKVTVVLDAWAPVPDEDGRTRTMRQNKRAEFLRIFHTDRRNVFGESVAGLLQTHNTFQHWTMGAEDSNRLARKAERTMTGAVDKLDAEFAAIVAEVFALESVPA